MQKAGKIGNFWGNAFPSRVGTLELLSTCVQSNRLPEGLHRLPYLRASYIIGRDDQEDDPDNGGGHGDDAMAGARSRAIL